MKSLALAIGIVVALGATLFGIFHMLGVVDKVAGPLAGSTLGFITFVHDKVDKALSSGRSLMTPGIVPVDEFTIRWPWMLLYTSFMHIAIGDMTALAYALPAKAIIEMTAGATPPLQMTAEQFGRGILGLLVMPTLGWCLFLLGRWVGIRSARAGYWIMPLSVVLSRGVEISITYLSSPRERAFLLDLAGDRKFLPALLLTPLLVMGIGLLGVWRGNTVRLGAYFNSLLKRVSGPTREVLLAMTFEEAKAATPMTTAI